MKLIVIGGVAAGMSAASKFKRINKDSQIVVYERDSTLSYGACGLPYFISGDNNDVSKLIARSEEEFNERGIETNTFHEVIKIFPEQKKVLVRNIKNNAVFTDNYDKLMISTGAQAIRLNILGSNFANVNILSNLEDSLRLREAVTDESINNIVIIGAGAIGIEMAEAIRKRGKQARIIELNGQVLNGFSEEIASIAEKELIENGVQINLNESLLRILGETKVEYVETNLGKYPADVVLMSVGVKPATQFVQGSGIALANNGAIIVDREMRTNIKDIYAAGDCSQVYHRIKEENSYIPLGTNANKQGRIAGSNLAGAREKHPGALGSIAIKVFDLEMGKTGLSETEAEEMKVDYDTSFVESTNHPSYYPNQKPIWIKLIYEKGSRKILGAEAIGYDGVILRIDIFAVAIHAGLTTDELGMVDLCYAPPFAGVWDAVHIASNAAD